MSRFETSLHGIDPSKYTMRYEALHLSDRTTSSTYLTSAPNPIPGSKKMLEDDLHQFQLYTRGRTRAKDRQGYIDELSKQKALFPHEALISSHPTHVSRLRVSHATIDAKQVKEFLNMSRRRPIGALPHDTAPYPQMILFEPDDCAYRDWLIDWTNAWCK
ncbi:hypothetical protein Pst134EA_026677 [Puccinia striiformis f. sp. tritici]|nr:hypothetical protein Pst134EA_026677 [Puccinia striiformis f. sp. tritici]KAH9442883.1 hypothetical protein Pst134EB_027236 [Puccinia striiformis f. sp. tritici]KAH9449964.1 hypothetical protein Pst134EA_026677 [Puccinia striiformis f. sp. tritici]